MTTHKTDSIIHLVSGLEYNSDINNGIFSVIKEFDLTALIKEYKLLIKSDKFERIEISGFALISYDGFIKWLVETGYIIDANSEEINLDHEFNTSLTDEEAETKRQALEAQEKFLAEQAKIEKNRPAKEW